MNIQVGLVYVNHHGVIFRIESESCPGCYWVTSSAGRGFWRMYADDIVMYLQDKGYRQDGWRL